MNVAILISPFITDIVPRLPPIATAYIVGALKSNERVARIEVADLNAGLAKLLNASESNYNLLNRIFGGVLFAIPGKMPLNEFLVDALPSYEIFLIFKYFIEDEYNEDIMFNYIQNMSNFLSVDFTKALYLLEVLYHFFYSISKWIAHRYDMILIYATNTASATASALLASLIKKIDSSLPIVGVGNIWVIPHIVKLFVEFGDIDAVLYWKYEISINNFIKFYDNEKYIENIPNLMYKYKGYLRYSKEDLRIDLNELPFPDFSLHDIELYSYLNDGIVTLPVEASRGCIFQCNFCISRKFFAKENVENLRLQAKSSRRIIEEIKDLLKFKPDRITFIDLTFNAERKLFKQVLDLLIEEKFDVDFGCNLRVDLINDEDINRLAKANFYKVILGIESFNAESISLYNKSSNPDYYVSCAIKYPVKMLNAGIIPQINLLFNHPYQTNIDNDLKAFINYVNFVKSEKLPIFEIYPSTVYIPWGSDLYRNIIIKSKHVNIINIKIPEYLKNIISKFPPRIINIITSLPYIIRLPYRIQSIYVQTKDEIHQLVYSTWSPYHEIAFYIAKISNRRKSMRKYVKVLLRNQEIQEVDITFLYSLLLSKFLS